MLVKIAGMGSDWLRFMRICTESTCAALVISGSSQEEILLGANFMYPMMMSSVGIVACIITSLFATQNSLSVDRKEKIESTLKWQLNYFNNNLRQIIPAIVLVSIYLLPDNID